MIGLILFCFGTAALSSFLDMSFQKGMIFRKYYNWITYHFYLDNHGRVETGYSITGVPCKESAKRVRRQGCIVTCNDAKNTVWYTFVSKNKFIWLWKILGGCIYCFGTWLFIVLFLAKWCLEAGVRPDFIGFILGIGINYVFIKLIEKIHE